VLTKKPLPTDPRNEPCLYGWPQNQVAEYVVIRTTDFFTLSYWEASIEASIVFNGAEVAFLAATATARDNSAVTYEALDRQQN